jgi:radical SAM protein with 4Fe4S-binding SPASM domain
MECPHIPIISLTRLAYRLDKQISRSRIPITGSIEVTARCNLQCAHCYINLPAGDRQAMEHELNTEEFCSIIDQAVDEGCLWLLLTGGEPFIRHDFFDIYTHAKRRGLLITLFTNGTTITPRIADYLAEWKPLSMEISLYGSTQATYELITGIPGSYGRCIRGIELLLERKIPLKLKTPVMTLNVHDIWKVKSFTEKLGVDFRFDPVLNVRLDGDMKPAKYRITPEEIVLLDLSDEKRMEDWKKFCEEYWGPPPKPENIYQCGAGINTFHIDPYGKLSTCLMSRIPSFDLQCGSFHDGWYDFIPKVISEKWSRGVPCRNCNLYPLCGQCPAYAQMEYGDAEKPVEYLCKIAHVRAEAFGLNNKSGGEQHG